MLRAVSSWFSLWVGAHVPVAERLPSGATLSQAWLHLVALIADRDATVADAVPLSASLCVCVCVCVYI